MTSTLPDNASLGPLREEVRTLHRQVSEGDAAGTGFVRRHHPGPELALADRSGPFSLDDAELTVARSYGFSDWASVVHYLGIVADLAVDPSRVDADTLAAPDRFCALSVLGYTDDDAPQRRAAAAQMAAAEPDLGTQHVWAAAAAADPLALSAHLAGQRDLATITGGPYGWVPLMYLCYSRVELGRTRSQVLAAATLLLQAGADPNAGYLWRGMSTPFTALTGAFGEGELGPRRQPRHPCAPELAMLLLEWGAHPVDRQALYNRMFLPDDSHLKLLFGHGLADAGPSPWELRLGEAIPTREQMWHTQISWATEHGYSRRLALLARHGIVGYGARDHPQSG